LHVAGAAAGLEPGHRRGLVPRRRLLRPLPPARLHLDVHRQPAGALVPAVPVAVPGRPGRLGHRHAQHDHLRTGIGVLQLPAGPGCAPPPGPPVRLPQRHAAPDHRSGRAAGHGRGGRAAHRDRLLLPGPGLPHPPGDPEPGLLPAAASLPVHRHRRADRQLHHRRRLRPGRPAGPRPDAGRGQMTAAQPLPDPTTAPEEPAAAAPEAPRREALYFALRNPKLIVGLTIVLLFLLVGLVVPPFLEHGPGDRYAPPLLPPSGEHWFGTTQFGQDLFTQFAYGVRATFLVGLLGGGIAAVIGMTIGFVAG